MKKDWSLIPGEEVTYFIAGGGLIKVGRTGNIHKRFRELQCGSPVPLVCLGYMRARDLSEEYAHRELKPFRQHGERFEPCPLLDEWVAIAQAWMLDVKAPRPIGLLEAIA